MAASSDESLGSDTEGKVYEDKETSNWTLKLLIALRDAKTKSVLDRRRRQRAEGDLLLRRWAKRASRRIAFLGCSLGWVVGWALHEATLLFNQLSEELREISGVLVCVCHVRTSR